MKKITLLAFITFLSLYSAAQVSIGCYSDCDTLSNVVLNNATKFEINPNGEYFEKYKLNEGRLRSFEMTISINGTFRAIKSISFDNSLTNEMRKAMLASTGKINIENIMVQLKNGNMMRIGNTTFYRAKTVYKRCK